MTFNLLPTAMQATSILGCNKSFDYIQTTEVTINSIGIEIPSKTDIKTYIGSIQPVSNKMYEQLGLDLNHNYKIVYCPELLKSLAESEIPGKIKYNNSYYDIIENKNWWETNGYTKCVICEIKAKKDEQNYL